MELGYCKHFLIYEGQAHLNADSTVPDDHHLLLAHAQDIMGPWQKHLYGSDSFPGSDDVVIANRAPHEGSSTPDVYSFAGVPDLIYDGDDQVWRMWFVAEDTSMAPLRYAESTDDGLTWGFGTNASQPIDCWDGTSSAHDTGLCKLIEWDSTAVPPDFSPTSKVPDAVDPAFAVVDYDGDNTAELLMFTTSVDDDCDTNSGLGDPAVFLVSAHEAMGDQSTGIQWEWLSNVYLDNTTGIVLEEDTAVCEGDDADYSDKDDGVADPTVVKFADGKWIMFLQMNFKIYASASGFQCSDFIDNDSDGDVDFPDDVSCLSPTDDTE